MGIGVGLRGEGVTGWAPKGKKKMRRWFQTGGGRVKKGPNFGEQKDGWSKPSPVGKGWTGEGCKVGRRKWKGSGVAERKGSGETNVLCPVSRGVWGKKEQNGKRSVKI